VSPRVGDDAFFFAKNDRTAAMDIQLNFINQSNDANNSEIVVFQPNVAENFGDTAVAWLVIQNCGRGDNHPFTYPMSMSVSAGDSYGNYTPRLPAIDGQLFAMTHTLSGDELSLAGRGTSPQEVQLENRLPDGTIIAMLFKDNRLFAACPNILPGQTASFRFKPTILIGVVSQVAPGQVLNKAIMSSVHTEISLLGLASADIVMTGGGSGPDAKPFQFNLENIVAP
jgi:hypothetical protein